MHYYHLFGHLYPWPSIPCPSNSLFREFPLVGGTKAHTHTLSRPNPFRRINEGSLSLRSHSHSHSALLSFLPWLCSPQIPSFICCDKHSSPSRPWVIEQKVPEQNLTIQVISTHTTLRQLSRQENPFSMAHSHFMSSLKKYWSHVLYSYCSGWRSHGVRSFRLRWKRGLERWGKRRKDTMSEQVNKQRGFFYLKMAKGKIPKYRTSLCKLKQYPWPMGKARIFLTDGGKMCKMLWYLFGTGLPWLWAVCMYCEQLKADKGPIGYRNAPSFFFFGRCDVWT